MARSLRDIIDEVNNLGMQTQRGAFWNSAEIDEALKQIEELLLGAVGGELDDSNGWEWAFSDGAKCCSGDDFAAYGNHIKEEIRQELKKRLGGSDE